MGFGGFFKVLLSIFMCNLYVCFSGLDSVQWDDVDNFRARNRPLLFLCNQLKSMYKLQFIEYDNFTLFIHSLMLPYSCQESMILHRTYTVNIIRSISSRTLVVQFIRILSHESALEVLRILQLL